MARLASKVAVVTGASKGIGRAIGEVLAREGAKVALLDIDAEAGIQTQNALRHAGGEALFIPTDVSQFDSLQASAEEVRQAYGTVHILCCNAGIYPSAQLDEMTEADWDKVMGVNLRGMFLTVKAYLPLLKQQRGGRIVLTSSITGPITGYSGWTHYGATKAGMLGFMRSAAIELAPYEITVNAVLPGNILTEGVQALGEEYIEAMNRTIPLGRLGTPEEVALAVLFLASDDARYITGHALVVDGGQILPESHLALEPFTPNA